MTEIIELGRIQSLLKTVDVAAVIEAGFGAYSRGEAVVPPVGELTFSDPPGETHIKYGYVREQPFFVIKIASGFYQNPALGLSSSQGVMLVFCQRSGVLKAVLLDHGYLTDVRTAAAGAVVAKYMAPARVNRIGILGAGIQARMQLDRLRAVVACDSALIWTANETRRREMRDYFKTTSLELSFTEKPAEVARNCNLIVTTTPATSPLLQVEDIQPGTHITAVGSDSAHKIELDPRILGRADLVVADSLSQSESRGEVYRAVEAGALDRADVAELGRLINRGERIRRDEQQITVADLTGVAVQDIQIATAVFQQYSRETP